MDANTKTELELVDQRIQRLSEAIAASGGSEAGILLQHLARILRQLEAEPRLIKIEDTRNDETPFFTWLPALQVAAVLARLYVDRERLARA